MGRERDEQVFGAETFEMNIRIEKSGMVCENLQVLEIGLLEMTQMNS